jgi:hypothetical protein
VSAPSVEYPRDLPDLRLWLMDQWRPGGPLDRTATWVNALQERMGAQQQGVSAMSADFDHRALKRAALWWVTEDMVDLVIHAAPDLNVTLDLDFIPDPHGFVYFAKPLVGRDADNAERQIKVDAVLWGTSTLPPLAERSDPVRVISISSYRKTDTRGNIESGLAELADTILAATVATQGGTSGFVPLGEMWVPLGRTDWVLGEKANAPIFGFFDSTHTESMAEDRRWLAAVWLLATQPGLAEERTEIPSRPVRRRSDRKDVSSNVRIVNLRAAKTVVDPDAPVGAKHVEWSHRWLVGAHWRNQPYGPGRSLRRPTLILPYVKGPKDKPLEIREKVKVVKP